MIRNIIFDIGNVLTDYRWEGNDQKNRKGIYYASAVGRV